MQRTKSRRAMGASDETDETFEAPTVLLEICAVFVAMLDEPGICAGCGHLSEDHTDSAPAEARRAAGAGMSGSVAA